MLIGNIKNKKLTFKWGKMYEKVWEVIMEKFKNTT